MDFPDQLKVKNWVFRFSLDGKLEKVVSGVGQNDKDGNPVVGSEEDTLQDVNDPDVQDRARTELKFWLKTATAMIKQDSESAKRATAAAASSDLKSQETSPQSAPDTSH